MAGSRCPKCGGDTEVDAEEWSRGHDHADVPLPCPKCGAELHAYYDEYESEGGFWAFETEDEE